MKVRTVFTLIVLFSATAVLGQKTKDFPKVFTTARFAYVETQYGPVDQSVLDPRVTSEDRHAVANLEKALHSWGRYQLTAKPSEAELIFVVRPGRVADVGGGIQVSRGSRQPGMPNPNDVGPVFGGEVGQPNDVLAVYVVDPNGKLGYPLWQQILNHGLDTPDMLLFQKFKEQVEAATK